VTDAAIAELAPALGVRAACDAVGAARASYYRRHRISPAPARVAPIPHRDRPQPRALSQAEQQAILHELHSDRFADLAPAEVWAILLDEGRYLGSISTFYRLLRQAGETRERRRQATHPTTVKPELVADAPNSTWSWDITKLHGPAKWTYYYLLVTWNQVAGWIITDRHHDHELRGPVGREHRGELARSRSARASRGVAHDLDQSGPCATHHRRLCAGSRGVPAGL
jgi:putative transposase